MRTDKLKLITASTLILLGTQSGNVLAEESTASQSADQAAAPTQTTAPTQPPAAAQAPQPGYQSYPYQAQPYYYPAYPPYYGPYKRKRNRGFSFSSDDGPDFGSWGDRDRGYYDRGPRYPAPWDRGRGSGSGFGFSSDDGPDWDSRRGPYYGPRYDRGYYDRGPRFRGPWDDDNGSGMNFSW